MPDIALFLDLDNITISLDEANLAVELQLIIDTIEEKCEGRIVLRRAFGDWKQHSEIVRQLTTLGFDLQAVMRLNSSEKNLADIQLVVDVAETLLNGSNYDTYALITGDRDFVPLVQLLRQRGKWVVGVGVQRSSSLALAQICDRYFYYDDITSIAYQEIDQKMRVWIKKTIELHLANGERLAASLFRQHLDSVSERAFGESVYGTRWKVKQVLEHFPDLLSLEQEDTTLYVLATKNQSSTPMVVKQGQSSADMPLSASIPPAPVLATPLTHSPEEYRTQLKKNGLRVVASPQRLWLLSAIYQLCQTKLIWVRNELLEALLAVPDRPEMVSRTMISDFFRVLEKANLLISADKKISGVTEYQWQLGRQKPLSHAILLSDLSYLLALRDVVTEIKLESATIALYESAERISYIRYLLKLLDK